MFGLKCLVWDPGSGSIISPMHAVVWPNGVVRAICTLGQSGGNGRMPFLPRFEIHRAPAFGCTCGIYAHGEDKLHLHKAGFGWVDNCNSFRIPRLFSALVAAYGRVVEHTWGWRAEEAEILAIGPVPVDPLFARWGGREAATAIGVPYFESVEELSKYAKEIPRPIVETLEIVPRVQGTGQAGRGKLVAASPDNFVDRLADEGETEDES